MSPVHVLEHDNHLLFVEKPAGQPSVPDESGAPSLLDEARRWIEVTYEKPGRAYLGVVHRLDRPVSGVVCFARTSKAAARLTRAFRESLATKTYLAVSAREPGPGEGEIVQWLVKDPSRNHVRAFDREHPGAKRAHTSWRVLARAPGRVLFELTPTTGRSHQLRVALASLGCPLLGDLRYGAAEPLSDRSIALHARALEVPHPTRRETVRVVVEPHGKIWDFRAARPPRSP